MKLLRRRKFLHLAAGAAALPIMSRAARAQTYPSRPVHWIVGYTPGGGNDIFARLMGQWLQERLGQPFIIENRPGANSNIATEVVVNAPADGYTLLLANFGNASNASLYQNLKFNFIRDVTPVAGIVRVPNLMLVNQSVPAKTVPEFIAYLKANPGKVNMSSAGIGSTGHLAGEFFKMIAGVEFTHVPYRGNAPALADLLGGQVQLLFASLSSSIEYIRTGKVRGLAITSATRSEAAPDLPTVAEFFPGYEVSSWYGLCAPAGTPAPVLDKVHADLTAVLHLPELQQRFKDMVIEVAPTSREEFAQFIRAETARWARVIKEAGIPQQ